MDQTGRVGALEEGAVELRGGVSEAQSSIEQARSQAAALSEDVSAAMRAKEGLESEVRASLGRLQSDVEAYMKRIGGR